MLELATGAWTVWAGSVDLPGCEQVRTRGVTCLGVISYAIYQERIN